MTLRRYRPLGAVRITNYAWLHAQTNPTPATPEPLVSFSGKHVDGTAHRLSGCTCGHEGRLDTPAGRTGQ